MTWPVQLSVWEKGDQSDQCATPRQSHQAMLGEHIRSLLILVILVNIWKFCQRMTQFCSVKCRLNHTVLLILVDPSDTTMYFIDIRGCMCCMQASASQRITKISFLTPV